MMAVVSWIAIVVLTVGSIAIFVWAMVDLWRGRT